MSKKEKLEKILFVPIAFIYAIVKPVAKIFKKVFGFISLCFMMLVSPILMKRQKEKAPINEKDFVDFVENENQ